MKKSFKKILASLLVAVMVLSVSPIDSISEIDFSSLFSIKAAAITSGKFTYELSGTSATITGYSGTDSNLTIPSKLDGNTVVAIKYGVFANNTDLTSVTLPDTLVELGNIHSNYAGAFENCRKLKTVTFKKGTKDAAIGYNAFQGCASLQSITIPGNYTKICFDAFANCISLRSFTFEESNYTHANQIISDNAFWGAENLETLSLPTTLVSIGKEAFQHCGVSSLVIPEGVTTIGYSAFAYSPNLTSVTLPSTLTELGNIHSNYTGTFEECTKLKTVTFKKGTKDAVIGYNAFQGCTSLQSVKLPGNYSKLCFDAFANCTSLQSFTWDKSDYSYANQIISDNVFWGAENLETLSLPTTLVSIGKEAFQHCGVSSLVIPEGVTTIGYSAFAYSPNLTSVTLPSTLTELGNIHSNYTGTFEECTKLKTVTFKKGTKDAVIGYNAFQGCTSLQSVKLPGNYSKLCFDAFANCTSLQSFTWDKSDYSYANQIVSDNVFWGAENLETLSLPTTLVSIGKEAFQHCGVSSLVIPEGVTTIGYSAFAYSPNLTSVTLPSTLTELGNIHSNYTGTFEGCSKLKTAIFTEGKKDLTIGYNIFKNCTSLTTVHLPLNLVNICKDAFAGSTANLTICSKSNDSYGKKFADSNSIKFKVCSGHVTSVIGDVNNDGNINSSDALLVLQYSVGSYALNGNAFTAADTNRDGKVNSSDALIILQFAVGKIDKI